MRFFIMGDSWGVGEWQKIDGCLKPIPDTGIDRWLREHGHDCTNISAGSASNFGQLRHAYWTLQNDRSYDFIIWFYTEPFRDIIETCIQDPEEAERQYPDFAPDDFPRCNYITEQNLKYAQMIYEEYGIPFITIGGHCCLPKSIQTYSFCRVKIDNWAAELLELDFDFPEYTWFAWQKFEMIFDHYNLDSKKFILDEYENLEKTKIIIETSKNSARFPDNGHPGRSEFKNLAQKILSIVT